MSYKHFTLEERKYLQQLLSEGLSYRKIAEILERSPSSISREVNRNRSKTKPKKKPNNKYWYNHWRAQNLYIGRRRNQHRQGLTPDSPEWNYIIEGLQKYWSPETICSSWHKAYPDQKQICISTIYRYIRQKKFPGITAKTNLRRRGKRYHIKEANYNSIQPDRTVLDWPESIFNRSRMGDWEGDTVYGGVGKGYLVTMVDRKTRYLKLGLIFKRTAEETRLAIEQMMEGLPVESITLDNGSEFAEFHELENNLSTLVYFAEPHKPWQRGTNENTNGILRFFFPKGCDLRKVTVGDLRYVEDLINNRPRKCLGWKSPAEVFLNSVALA